MRTLKNNLSAIIHHDAFGGILLMTAALAALVMDNSPLRSIYDAMLTTPVVVQVGAGGIEKPLLLWINDGLMAVFFFLVGLEIKREILEGRLSTWNQSALPVFAAVGGMAIPALIYVAFNWGSPSTLDGWAIPAATDIAFALGVLALVGSGVPPALKVFLLALAILDDLGAIIIIALFYTSDLSLASLAIAGVSTAVLVAFNLLGVRRISLYALIGVIMWVGVLKSGVHATLAGVIIALCIPLRVGENSGKAPLHVLEKALHPWVAFFIMPVFAFANAGVALDGLRFADLLAPLPLGIALGLFIGKQIGVFGFSWIGVRAGICRLPDGVTWTQVYGVSLLAGIGFTMSLFIGTLAFSDPEHAAAVRLGVLSGSILSGVMGFLVLKWSTRHARVSGPASGGHPVDGLARGEGHA